MKTIVFSMFLRGWDIRNHQFFQSEIIKNHACNPNMFFDTSNHIKYEKNHRKMSPMGHPKIIKNHKKSTLGHSRALLNEPWHQMITKLMPQ